MSQAEAFFFELTQEIPDGILGKMFGAHCLKMPNGKSAAMMWKDNIVVRSHGFEMDQALQLTGSRLFEPMAGKPMKNWVQVPFDHKDRWKHLVEMSAAAVKNTAKKVRKKTN